MDGEQAAPAGSDPQVMLLHTCPKPEWVFKGIRRGQPSKDGEPTSIVLLRCGTCRDVRHVQLLGAWTMDDFADTGLRSTT